MYIRYRLPVNVCVDAYKMQCFYLTDFFVLFFIAGATTLALFPAGHKVKRWK